jgi:hypothetical protein
LFVTWTVLFHDAFDAEFEALVDELQDELLAHAKLLAEFGPNLGRPTVDTLKGSQHANMKELRFSWNGHDHLSTQSQSGKESKHGKKTR